MIFVLVWGGAALSIFGLIGLLFSMYKVALAKKRVHQMKSYVSLFRERCLNLASLFLSVLGLMSVTIGVLVINKEIDSYSKFDICYITLKRGMYGTRYYIIF